jgi:hypothetical protein
MRMLEEAFAAIDTDQSGTLERDEVARGFGRTVVSEIEIPNLSVHLV